MLTPNSKRGFWTLAVIVAVACLTPAPASAQYTLTFDPEGQTGFQTQNICAGGTTGSYYSGCTIASGYGSVSGVSTVTNGLLTSFGSTTTSGNFLIYTGSVVGENAANANIAYMSSSATNQVGMFDITAAGSMKYITVDSLRLGLSNSAANNATEMVRFYDNSNVLIAADTILIARGTDVMIPVLASNVFGGVKIEFGQIAGTGISSAYFTIDNITYDAAALSPEPDTMVLLGTGLLVLSPMMFRRKRRKATA